MDAPAGAARPCEDFWFADGTVVLRSEDTLFKTYIGLLSGISLVFRDMFGVPQPPAQETENYEGLPFVCLSDTAWDITHFLKAIHTPGYAEENRLFSIFSAILRMSIKYDAAYFRKICIAKLERLYPINAADYCGRPKMREVFEDHTDDHMFNAVLALGREPGLRFIVPLTYFWMAPADSRDTARWRFLSTPYISADGKAYSVDQESILACLRGLFALSERHNMMIKDVFATAPSCMSKEACGHALDKGRADLVNLNRYWNALRDWDELHASDQMLGLICRACLACARRVWTNKWQVTWSVFPGFFGLPTWEELREG